MATRTISDLGGNFTANSAWVEGVAPAAQDDIVATGTSGNLVIDAGAGSIQIRSFDLTNYVGTLSGTGTILVRPTSAGTWNCKFAGTISWTGNLSINPNGATTIVDLYSNGKTISALLKLDTGVLNLRDNLTLSGLLTLTQGGFNTNDFDITCSGFSSNAANTRTANFGTSVITCNTTSSVSVGAAGLSISNTAYEFLITAAAANFTNSGSSIPYVNLHFTGSGSHYLTTYGQGINKLIVDGTANQTDSVTVNSSNITIASQLTLNGNSTINRLQVVSEANGTRRTLTCNGTLTCSYVDFRDISGAGSASWDLSAITGLSGDSGGNLGITFTDAETQTWNGVTGTWSDYTKWTSRIPLPQDNVILPDPGGTGRTLTANMPRLGKDITCTNNNATNKFTLSFTSQTNSIYGSLTLVSSTYMTFTRNKSTVFLSRSNPTIISAGQVFAAAQDLSISVPGNTMTFGDHFVSEGPVLLNSGTLSTNYNVTCSYRFVAAANTTVNMGDGTWTFLGLGGQGWQNSGTINAGNSIISYTYTGSTATTFIGGTATYNDISIAPGTGQLTFSGAFTFNNMILASDGIKNIVFTAGITYTMTGDTFFTGNTTAPTIVSPIMSGATLNGNLETSTGNDFANWTETVAGTSTITADTTNMHSGSKCVKFTVDSSMSNAQLSQTILTIGKTYKITYWAKVDSITGSPKIQVGSTGTGEFPDQLLTTDWTQYTLVLKATTTTFLVRRGNTSNSRTIWADDIVVEEITGLNVYSTTSDYFTINKTSGNLVTDYFNLYKCHATGGATFYAGSHSIDGGDNTGWLFSDLVTSGLGWLVLLDKQQVDGSPFGEG